MSKDKKIKRGRAIDCNIRQELAEVADAVAERKGHPPADERTSGNNDTGKSDRI